MTDGIFNLTFVLDPGSGELLPDGRWAFRLIQTTVPRPHYTMHAKETRALHDVVEDLNRPAVAPAGQPHAEIMDPLPLHSGNAKLTHKVKRKYLTQQEILDATDMHLSHPLDTAAYCAARLGMSNSNRFAYAVKHIARTVVAKTGSSHRMKIVGWKSEWRKAIAVVLDGMAPQTAALLRVEALMNTLHVGRHLGVAMVKDYDDFPGMQGDS